jgi:hypothetical protein
VLELSASKVIEVKVQSVSICQCFRGIMHKGVSVFGIIFCYRVIVSRLMGIRGYNLLRVIMIMGYNILGG